MSTIDERFAFITDENGVKYQVLKYAPAFDYKGDPILDENEQPIMIPVDWDEQATVALMNKVE